LQKYLGKLAELVYIDSKIIVLQCLSLHFLLPVPRPKYFTCRIQSSIIGFLRIIKHILAY